MHSLFFRCLLLACSLTLVLPGGWCCMLASLPAKGSDSRAAPSFPGTCCCDTARTASSSNTPIDPPRVPLPPGRCPCSGRFSKLPDGPTVIALDLSLPTALPPVLLSCAPSGEALAVSDILFPSFDPPLHLLNCVWLC